MWLYLVFSKRNCSLLGHGRFGCDGLRNPTVRILARILHWFAKVCASVAVGITLFGTDARALTQLHSKLHTHIATRTHSYTHTATNAQLHTHHTIYCKRKASNCPPVE